ncbi:uncharacterized protein LOC101858818 [Aplysia californica]|uniref:Uncharacterized protein LOC101858818 n=1 Tax=Aplysia californica TaxID=6500 RepID=A0ABM1AD01_APLCA|nr:uncharacterized protein LOC101858818 [Aplysia californica]
MEGDQTDAKNRGIQFVYEQWKNVTEHFRVSSSTRENWWRIIVRRYGEKWRFYHTMSHVQQMLCLYQQWKECIADLHTVCLAIFFHDIVYDPTSGNNELQSIVLFQKFAMDANLPDAVSERVAGMISATISHKANNPDDQDLCLFLDFDLSILGQSAEVYESYAEKIRQEYIHFSDESYREGRVKVLQGLLSSPRLFISKELGDLFEDQARENMRKEITSLQV